MHDNLYFYILLTEECACPLIVIPQLHNLLEIGIFIGSSLTFGWKQFPPTCAHCLNYLSTA